MERHVLQFDMLGMLGAQATEACKPVMGKYYREPEPSPGPLPVHLIEPLVRSFRDDKFVEDEGEVVLYKSEAALSK